VKTPYLSTANNSFETCIIDNFNVSIINEELDFSNLPKLSLTPLSNQEISASGMTQDTEVISEHIISWSMPANNTQNHQNESFWSSGFVLELPERGEVLINNIRIYPSHSGYSLQGKVAGEDYSNVFVFTQRKFNFLILLHKIGELFLENQSHRFG
ncbi:MAG: hypothetical protein HOH19_07310, partial [Kordiimonadaceae bacterium]|nr:hypothetical protein [Kordiimonadaceae bacterium]